MYVWPIFLKIGTSELGGSVSQKGQEVDERHELMGSVCFKRGTCQMVKLHLTPPPTHLCSFWTAQAANFVKWSDFYTATPITFYMFKYNNMKVFREGLLESLCWYPRFYDHQVCPLSDGRCLTFTRGHREQV